MSLLELAFSSGQLAALMRPKVAWMTATHPVVQESALLKARPTPAAPPIPQPPSTPETVRETFDRHEQGETRVEPRRKLSVDTMCTSCRKPKHYGPCKKPIPIKQGDFNLGMTADTAMDDPSTSPNYSSATSADSSLARARDGRPADEQAASNFADLFRHLGITSIANESTQTYGGLSKVSGDKTSGVPRGLVEHAAQLSKQMRNVPRPPEYPAIPQRPHSAAERRIPPTAMEPEALRQFKQFASITARYRANPIRNRLLSAQLGDQISRAIAGGTTVEQMAPAIAEAQAARTIARRKLGQFFLRAASVGETRGGTVSNQKHGGVPVNLEAAAQPSIQRGIDHMMASPSVRPSVLPRPLQAEFGRMPFTQLTPQQTSEYRSWASKAKGLNQDPLLNRWGAHAGGHAIGKAIAGGMSPTSPEITNAIGIARRARELARAKLGAERFMLRSASIGETRGGTTAPLLGLDGGQVIDRAFKQNDNAADSTGMDSSGAPSPGPIA